MKDKDTPLYLVRLWSKIAPDCYDTLDNCTAAQGISLDWPDYCPLPIAAACAYLDQQGLDPQDAAVIASELVACWAWRRNKIIYRFDADLSGMLAEQAEELTDDNVLPAELLIHLPYPCIFIKADFSEYGFGGFWAWMEHDVNEHRDELRVQFVAENMRRSIGFALHLLPGASIGECIADTVKYTAAINDMMNVICDDWSKSTQPIMRAIEHILYIVADNAEIIDAPHIVNPSVTRDEKADKAGNVKEKLVGFRLGAAIRKTRAAGRSASETGTGKKKAPHSRRGHWHHFWTGPLKGERKLIIKWLAPMYINAEQGKEDNIVIIPVKGIRTDDEGGE